ncbi:MAG: helix-turn-helix domain-containing protein [Oscillospiraceae bacterium]|nr:helix-turn-helix domain-containing protein [Oscillospiraceae bacterium]
MQKKINISRSNFANIENGNINLTERVINDISRTFLVNKEWILDGNGEIFVDWNDILTSKILSLYQKLNSKNKKYLKGYIDRLIDEQNNMATLKNYRTEITGMPYGTEVADRVGKYAAQIADLIKLKDNLKKCIDELNKLDGYIQSVDDSLIRQIIMYRFICCFSWIKIACNIGGGNTADGVRIKLARFINRC